MACRRLPGALGHPRRARGAAPGARPAGAAERLVQQARLPAARLRVGAGAGRRRPAARSRRSPTWRSAATTPVSATYMPLERAREIGALALFGENYDEEVRVVEMGGAWSRELCGGTHVAHSSQVGLVTLTGESSVGAGVAPGRGVRRHRGASATSRKERTLVSQLADLLKVQPGPAARPHRADGRPGPRRRQGAGRRPARRSSAPRRPSWRRGPRRLRRRVRRPHRGRRHRRRRAALPGARRARPARQRASGRRRGVRRLRQRRDPASSSPSTTPAASGASRPAPWSASPRRRSAAAGAARTTSPRAAAPTRARSARR